MAEGGIGIVPSEDCPLADWSKEGISVLWGSCLVRLSELGDESADALVTDPPAGISFMGRSWDSSHGGRDRWVGVMSEIFEQCRRILKPGAHGLVWALPRTSHWTATALEDAGFEIRDIITHHFGSGFPKSLDISKAMDRMAGAKREVVGDKLARPGYHLHPGVAVGGALGQGINGHTREERFRAAQVSAPATDAARQWQGWGTALKPATEHWILVRKPLTEATVAANVLKHGTGALNIDGCRIGLEPTLRASGANNDGESWRMGVRPHVNGSEAGRWPANLVLSHSEDCRPVGTQRVRSQNPEYRDADGSSRASDYGLKARPRNTGIGYADADGLETVEAWECVEGCPVAELDRQSGTKRNGSGIASSRSGGIGGGYGDRGGASRFFYVAKASASERSAGLPPGERNQHPTVKPLALMRYLCRLITPPRGTVLDPFCGSGTTLVAAKAEGFQAIGIEQDHQWLPVITARIDHCSYQPAIEVTSQIVD